MTYKQIQTEYTGQYGKFIKSCWIADVKREYSLTKRIAHNRVDNNSVKYPCPTLEIRNRIKQIMKLK